METTVQKQKTVMRLVDGKKVRVPADAATETPEATIRRLAGELAEKSRWWHQEYEKCQRLEKRITHLEASLRSIGILAKVELGELTAPDSYSRDHEIPF